jgi:DNA polymerase/3'-5' exonuclease PolX
MIKFWYKNKKNPKSFKVEANTSNQEVFWAEGFGHSADAITYSFKDFLENNKVREEIIEELGIHQYVEIVLFVQDDIKRESPELLTWLHIRTRALLDIRKAKTIDEASKIAGQALCVGAGIEEILVRLVKEDSI